MKLKYQPSDLAYYTTWWLNSKPSNSTQITTLSVQNSIKSDDECIIIQQVIIYIIIYTFYLLFQNINQDELQLNCCIPIKRFRIKR